MTVYTRQAIQRLFRSSQSLLLIFLFLGIATPVTATMVGKAEPTSQASAPAVLPISLQQQESVALFKEIFKLSSEQNKTEQLERITELYSQIIQKCPDAPLAQESYFQLIEIFFNDRTPPLKKKACDLFGQFKSKYPDSRSLGVIKYAMAKGFYANELWDDLVKLEASSVAEYFATGKIDTPISLFYYSEAKYNLAEFEAAGQGYTALVENFPDTLVAQTALKKLARIQLLRN